MEVEAVLWFRKLTVKQTADNSSSSNGGVDARVAFIFVNKSKFVAAVIGKGNCEGNVCACVLHLNLVNTQQQQQKTVCSAQQKILLLLVFRSICKKRKWQALLYMSAVGWQSQQQQQTAVL